MSDKCENCKKFDNISLEVDGKEIPMHSFVKNIIASSIKGMVSTLKDVENPKSILIRIDE
jgi:hypothetical protein